MSSKVNTRIAEYTNDASIGVTAYDFEITPDKLDAEELCLWVLSDDQAVTVVVRLEAQGAAAPISGVSATTTAGEWEPIPLPPNVALVGKLIARITTGATPPSNIYAHLAGLRQH